MSLVVQQFCGFRDFPYFELFKKMRELAYLYKGKWYPCAHLHILYVGFEFSLLVGTPPSS